ncbi:hypothetical protein [Rubritalea sp.]|uniref:hypothetical protein n=1 Tax=Rubritalea sp. TaxID=2109375 RepID=UPI003EF106BB
MKAFISYISIALAISSYAEDEEWYDANGNLVRVLPASEPVNEWKPHWQMTAKDDSEKFTWNTRRPYVRSARPYLGYPSYYRSGFGCGTGYYSPYRYHQFQRTNYGFRGYYSSSGNWGIRIGN